MCPNQLRLLIVSVTPILTNLTLGAIEATGTGADVGFDTSPTIQTHWIADSWRWRQWNIEPIAKHTVVEKRYVRHGLLSRNTWCWLALPELHVGPYQPDLHLHTSGEVHSPPFSQCLLHTTEQRHTETQLHTTTPNPYTHIPFFFRQADTGLDNCRETWYTPERIKLIISHWFHILVPRNRKDRCRDSWPDRFLHAGKMAHS